MFEARFGPAAARVQITGTGFVSTLTIDLATAVLPSGIRFVGGPFSDDTLILNGTSGNDQFSINDAAGAIDWQGSEVADYQAVQQLSINSFGGDDQVIFQMGPASTTTLQYDGGPDSGVGIRDSLEIFGTSRQRLDRRRRLQLGRQVPDSERRDAANLRRRRRRRDNQ